MLPSPIESVPSQTQENNVDPSTEAGEAAIMLPSPSITETAAETNVEVMEHQPHHGVEPSTEQKETIRQLQQLRGFKRSRDRAASKCLIGMNYKNRSEQDVKNLTPKKGHAKINPRTTQIRYVLDQYKQKKPILELHHAFDFSVAFWNFIYNFFWILSFPILLYREGKAGFRARDMLSFFAFPFFPWLATNVAFWMSSTETKNCFVFPFVIMNLLRVSCMLVLAIKWGYYTAQTLCEYNDSTNKITFDYIHSLELIPGWLMQSPLSIARELYYTEQRLGIDLSALRMTFRDTKAFDLNSGKHCSCSRYWTTLDWFVPYVFLNVVSGESFLKPSLFIYWMLGLQILMFYTIIARMLPWSSAQASFAMCDVYCWVIVGTLPLQLGLTVYSAWLWCMCMAFDMTRRWSRMRLCTHLLDPKRETFQGAEMRSSYKAQLFASVAKLKRKNLKVLDLQTIDLYSSQTLYSWSQFRTVLFDAGKMFFEREEAYNGLMILSALFILLFLLYSLITENIVIVWEDVILTLIIAVFILGPSMWVLSYGNGLNYQTSKQQKILSERAVDMLHFEYMAEDKKAMYWVEEIRKAREMCDAVIDVLNLHEYDVSFLGIKVDNSVFQLIVSVIGITLYLIGWHVYQNMINQNKQIEQPSKKKRKIHTP
eukprot:390018_1